MGCPQESCCGPGLWNGTMERDCGTMEPGLLKSHETRSFCRRSCYYFARQNATEAEAYANSDLARIEKWAKENKLTFNETKYKAMMITRHRSNDTINVYFNNRRLEQVTEMKCLGIYFDRRLTFDKHIENIVEISTTMTHMLGKSAKLHWGLGHKCLKIIYEGALIPFITYGAPVWEEAAGKHRNFCKLQRAQRLMTIKIAKAYRTLSYDASCVMGGSHP